MKHASAAAANEGSNAILEEKARGREGTEGAKLGAGVNGMEGGALPTCERLL